MSINRQQIAGTTPTRKGLAGIQVFSFRRRNHLDKTNAEGQEELKKLYQPTDKTELV